MKRENKIKSTVNNLDITLLPVVFALGNTGVHVNI